MAVELAQGYVSLSVSTQGMGKQIASQFAGVSREADKAGKDSGKRFGGGFGGTVKAALGAAAIYQGISAGIGFLKEANGEARESQKVGATTAQIIRATGGAAKVSAVDVGNLAAKISAKAGVDDEAIQSGANLLLTFKNVRNEAGAGGAVFDRATQSAVDLSAAGFGSVSGASKMLGKALNDPVKGISALGRAGVTFTEQQKEQIGVMVQSGDTLGAQKIILGEVESQVGGVAAASATMGEKLSVSFGNFKEQIGTALLPVIDRVGGVLVNTVIPAVSGFIQGMTEGTGAGGKFAGVLKGIGTFVMETVVPAFRSFGDFIGRVVDAFQNADVGGGIGGFVGRIGAALKVIGPTIGNALASAAKALWGWIAPQIGPALAALGGWLQSLGSWFVGTAVPWLAGKALALGSALIGWIAPKIPALLAGLGQFVGAAVGWLIGTAVPWLVTTATRLAASLIGWIAPKIPGLLAELGKFIGSAVLWLVTKGVPLLVGAAGLLAFNIIKGFVAGIAQSNIGQSIIPYFKAAWDAVAGAVSGAWTAIRNAVVTAWNAIGTFFSGAAATVTAPVGRVWGAIASGVSSAWTAIRNAVSAAWTGIATFFASAGGTVTSSIARVWAAIASGVSTAWSAIRAAVSTAWTAIGNFFRTAIAAVVAPVTAAWAAIRAGVGVAFGAIGAVIRTAIGLWVTIVRVQIAIIGTVLSLAWTAIRAVATAAWNGVRLVITTVWNAIRPFVTAAVTALRNVVTVGWNAIRTVTATVWNAIRTVISTVWTAIRAVFTAAMNAVRAAFSVWWNALRANATAVFNAIRTVISTVWTAVRAVFTAAMAAVRAAFSAWWNALRANATTIFNAIRTLISTVWTAIRGVFTTAMAAVRTAFSTWWNNLRSNATAVFNAIRAFVNTVWNQIKSLWSAAQTVVRNAWSTFWGTIKSVGSAAIEWVRAQINSKLDAVRGIVSRFVSAVGSIWAGIKDKFAAPWNWVKNNVLDKIASAYNAVAKVVGAPTLNLADGGPVNAGGSPTEGAVGRANGGPIPLRAAGGRIRGRGGPRQDNIAGIDRRTGVQTSWVSAGEYVVNAKQYRKNKQVVESINSGLDFNEAVSRRLDRQAVARAFGGEIPRLWLGGGTKPAAGAVSKHSGYPNARWAGDINEPGAADIGHAVVAYKAGVVAAVRSMTTSYGKHIRLNHADNERTLYAHLSQFSVSPGQRVSEGQKIGEKGNTGNSTGPHLHFELAGGSNKLTDKVTGSVGAALNSVLEMIKPRAMFRAATNPILGLIDKGLGALPGGDTPFAQMMGKFPRKIVDLLANKLPESFGIEADGGSGDGVAVGAGSGDRMKNASVIAQVGKGGGKRAQTIGLITAIVESGLRNVNYGDRDSLGLFQQRAPWGPASARMNPRTSAGMFYNGGRGGQRGLYDIPGWRGMSMGAAAQRVQVSAFPGRYQTKVKEAESILNALKMADGGIVKGGRGGVYAHIGERQQDELVTPLPRNWKSMDRRTADGGAGSTTEAPTFVFYTYNPIAEKQSQTTNRALQRVSNLGLV
jgi:murein DD-endopeptidase MepM/ murein hydrolase activator NlpD